MCVCFFFFFFFFFSFWSCYVSYVFIPFYIHSFLTYIPFLSFYYIKLPFKLINCHLYLCLHLLINSLFTFMQSKLLLLCNITNFSCKQRWHFLCPVLYSLPNKKNRNNSISVGFFSYLIRAPSGSSSLFSIDDLNR